MKKWLLRLTIGFTVAGLSMLASFALVQAEEIDEPDGSGESNSLYCQACHQEFYSLWVDGQHGNASSDPEFLEAWQAQGSKRECLTCHASGYDEATGTYLEGGVSCNACHGPVPADHPNQPMPTDRTATLCGECHTETYFEWQISGHRAEDMDCQSCHDPHATGLKVESSSELCSSCHRTRASGFAHSQHSQVGMVCADCHLEPLGGEPGDGHATRDHSFMVRLSTCNACHAYQMHDPVEVHDLSESAMSEESIASSEEVTLSGEAGLVSPLGFSAVAGLVGMATGMVLAPWLEKWYRRIREDDLF